MATRKPTPQRIPDAVRDAVERTIQATVGSAQQTRGRAQDAVDEIVRGAEAGAETVRARVREAIDTTRPATYEELRDLQAELRALDRRLAAIEERLPAQVETKRARPGSPAARRSPQQRGQVPQHHEGERAKAEAEQHAVERVDRSRRLAEALVARVPGRRILITGIASYLGTELARRLEADPEVEYVAGLDTRKPKASLDGRRLHRGRHPQPRDRQADRAHAGRHDRAQPDRPPARERGLLAAQGARRERDRLAAAARGLREGGHRAGRS